MAVVPAYRAHETSSLKIGLPVRGDQRQTALFASGNSRSSQPPPHEEDTNQLTHTFAALV